MFKEVIRIGIDHLAEIEFNLVVEFSMDRIMEVDQGMDKAVGMTLGEGFLEVVQENIKFKILEDRIIEVDIEEIIELRKERANATDV